MSLSAEGQALWSHVCIFSSTNTELTKEKTIILADFFFKRTLV